MKKEKQRNIPQVNIQSVNAKISANYDTLNAKNAVKTIRCLSFDELLVVSMHEFHGKRRRSVMRAALQEIENNSDALKDKYRSEAGEGFTILQVGQTGVGKSETINSLFGKEIAKTNRFMPETKKVSPYRSSYNDVNYTIYDTPGLGETTGGEELDRHYLSLMTDQCSSPDILWYVLRLDDNRIRKADMTAIELIHETFGDEIWDRTLTVFTHADKLTPQEFKIVLNHKTQIINKLITEVTDRRNKNVPAIAVANKKPHTPDGKDWLGELFTTSLEQLNPNRLNAFLLAFAEDLEIPKPQSPETTLQESDETEEVSEKRIKLDEEQWKRVEEKASGASLIAAGAAIGASIDAISGGTTLGIPTVIGAAIGGIVSFWNWLRDR